MSFDTTERSVQDGTVVELYDVVSPGKTWHLTTARADVSFGGNTYVATPGARSSVSIVDFSQNQTDVTIQIPVSHEIAQMYVAGVPPRDLLFTITRYHVLWGVSIQWWIGYASAIQMGGTGQAGGGGGGQRMAGFRVPSGINDALATDVPSVAAQRTCNHVLYDPFCTVNRGVGFTVPTTITGVSPDGRTITSLSAVPGAVGVGLSAVDWAFTGEILHLASSERRTITKQNTLTSFQVQAPFPNGTLHVGDAIQIFAGCTKTMDQCSLKFNNGINHGGHPYMPSSNIFYVGLRQALYNY